jgi:MoaA/NifB/PqqE/SkfB family radical SAM enzyme
MEIKFKENPITIKTIEVDGKKLTKQLLQQIELDDLYFLKDAEYYEYTKLIKRAKEELHNYEFTGQIVGYINMILDKDIVIKEFFNMPNINIIALRSILFINSDGELSRSYAHQSRFEALFGEVEQIYI